MSFIRACRPRDLAFVLTALPLLLAPLQDALHAQESPTANDAPSARARLGQALFVDQRFTNPATDYHGSCSSCHATGIDMAGRSERFYADYVSRSLTAGKETTLRNTPTLLGAGHWQRFGLDGQYESLRAIVEAKLTGPMTGWDADDRTRAGNAIQFTLLEEGTADGERYDSLFRQAYGVDLRQQTADQALQSAARALADYVGGLNWSETSVWDAFRTQNRIDSGPNPDEPPKSYAGRIEGRIGNLEGRLEVKRPEGFTREAYEGFKIFFRTFGEESVGNCVSCHVPPYFTDLAFHNVGISQAAYDRVHGNGAFGELEVDPSERPAERYLSSPSPERPGAADLGYWNYAPETELDHAFAAFKTPSLRNLGHSDPYMHDGAYETLGDAVSEIVRLSQLARAGKLRGADPELLSMRLDDDDVAPLVAFLRQLDEVGADRFRYYLIHLADD